MVEALRLAGAVGAERGLEEAGDGPAVAALVATGTWNTVIVMQIEF